MKICRETPNVKVVQNVGDLTEDTSLFILLTEVGSRPVISLENCAEGTDSCFSIATINDAVNS